MRRTAVNTLNSSEVMYLRSVGSSFMIRVDCVQRPRGKHKVMRGRRISKQSFAKPNALQCDPQSQQGFPFHATLLSSGPNNRLLQVIFLRLSHQHASYVTRSKPLPSARVTTRKVFSAFHSLSRQHPIHAMTNVLRSGESLRRTCMHCGSCLRTLPFTIFVNTIPDIVLLRLVGILNKKRRKCLIH